MIVKCAACQWIIGDTDYYSAALLSEYHTDYCEATEDERAAAVIRVQFESITQDLNL